MKVTLESDDIKEACLAHVQKMFPDKPIRVSNYFYSSSVDFEVGEEKAPIAPAAVAPAPPPPAVEEPDTDIPL